LDFNKKQNPRKEREKFILFAGNIIKTLRFSVFLGTE